MIPEKQFPPPHYPGLRDALSSPTSTHMPSLGRSLCLILAMGPLEVLELSATATGQEKYLCDAEKISIQEEGKTIHGA